MYQKSKYVVHPSWYASTDDVYESPTYALSQTRPATMYTHNTQTYTHQQRDRDRHMDPSLSPNTNIGQKVVPVPYQTVDLQKKSQSGILDTHAQNSFMQTQQVFQHHKERTGKGPKAGDTGIASDYNTTQYKQNTPYNCKLDDVKNEYTNGNVNLRQGNNIDRIETNASSHYEEIQSFSRNNSDVVQRRTGKYVDDNNTLTPNGMSQNDAPPDIVTRTRSARRTQPQHLANLSAHTDIQVRVNDAENCIYTQNQRPQPPSQSQAYRHPQYTHINEDNTQTHTRSRSRSQNRTCSNNAHTSVHTQAEVQQTWQETDRPHTHKAGHVRTYSTQSSQNPTQSLRINSQRSEKCVTVTVGRNSNTLAPSYRTQPQVYAQPPINQHTYTQPKPPTLTHTKPLTESSYSVDTDDTGGGVSPTICATFAFPNRTHTNNSSVSEDSDIDFHRRPQGHGELNSRHTRIQEQSTQPHPNELNFAARGIKADGANAPRGRSHAQEYSHIEGHTQQHQFVHPQSHACIQDRRYTQGPTQNQQSMSGTHSECESEAEYKEPYRRVSRTGRENVDTHTRADIHKHVAATHTRTRSRGETGQPPPETLISKQPGPYTNIHTAVENETHTPRHLQNRTQNRSKHSRLSHVPPQTQNMLDIEVPQKNKFSSAASVCSAVTTSTATGSVLSLGDGRVTSSNIGNQSNSVNNVNKTNQYNIRSKKSQGFITPAAETHHTHIRTNSRPRPPQPQKNIEYEYKTPQPKSVQYNQYNTYQSTQKQNISKDVICKSNGLKDNKFFTPLPHQSARFDGNKYDEYTNVVNRSELRASNMPRSRTCIESAGPHTHTHTRTFSHKRSVTPPRTDTSTRRRSAPDARTHTHMYDTRKERYIESYAQNMNGTQYMTYDCDYPQPRHAQFLQHARMEGDSHTPCVNKQSRVVMMEPAHTATVSTSCTDNSGGLPTIVCNTHKQATHTNTLNDTHKSTGVSALLTRVITKIKTADSHFWMQTVLWTLLALGLIAIVLILLGLFGAFA